MSTGRRTHQAHAAVAAVLLAILWLSAIPAAATGKKLQVIQDKAVVRLEATERSAVVETLGRGALLTLGSDVRTKVNWYYVYFTSLQSGNTRAGYIHESCVRKLFSSLIVIEIQSGDEILNPTEIDLDSPFQSDLQWGSTKADIIRAEGRPKGEDVSQGLSVLRYKRDLMKKKCEIEYLLDGNKLVGARCRLMENYADKNRYVEDYNRLREFLTARVGSPRAEGAVWQDHSYENLNDCWGIALGQGHVKFSSEWVFRDTEFRLTLVGANNHVVLGAEISDVKTKKPIS
ncbi:MAG: hypothetical protein ABSG19_14990 [Candidatus Aminicenantales bacterium]